MLVIDGVSHRYRTGPPVLRDISLIFDQPAGILAFVGASGSGKTTLLGIVGKLIRPTEGSVSFTAAGESSLVSWLFQTPNVLAYRTVIDNAAIGALATTPDWRAARDRASDVLERYGLAPLATAKTKTLSGGETQRLVLARAEMARAPLLLADEPTGQLDHDNTLMVARSLTELARSGTTVVVATHDPVVAAQADATLTITNGSGHYVASA